MFIFLLALVVTSAAGVAFNRDDIQTVKDIVESANKFLKDNHVTALRIPNMGVLSTDPIKMRKGTLEGLDTMQVFDEPDIYKKKNKDNSTTYLFFVNFGLQELGFHYDFQTSVPVSSKGEVWLIPEDHSLQAAGIVVLGENVCEARLYNVQVEDIGKLSIDIRPKNLPGKANLTQAILKFTVSRIIDVVDAAFEGETLDPAFQAWFSDFVCLHLKPKKLLDFIKKY